MSGVSQQPHPATHITDHQSCQRMFAVLFTIQRIQIFGHLSTKFKCPRFQQRERASSKHCEHFTNFVVASSTHHRSPWLPPTVILAKTRSLEPRCPLLPTAGAGDVSWQAVAVQRRQTSRKTGGNLGSGPAVTIGNFKVTWLRPTPGTSCSCCHLTSRAVPVSCPLFLSLHGTTFPLCPDCVVYCDL